ncbi:hypothetical protein CW304_32610 [Bacillus sp. UFRGS-B20]|nr:hypothetical protein CW304_32610 [Bacillus sp. UFRGS-B20]
MFRIRYLNSFFYRMLYFAVGIEVTTACFVELLTVFVFCNSTRNRSCPLLLECFSVDILHLQIARIHKSYNFFVHQNGREICGFISLQNRPYHLSTAPVKQSLPRCSGSFLCQTI